MNSEITLALLMLKASVLERELKKIRDGELPRNHETFDGIAVIGEEISRIAFHFEGE